MLAVLTLVRHYQVQIDTDAVYFPGYTSGVDWFEQTQLCHYYVKTTSRRRFDVTMTLLLRHVPAGIVATGAKPSYWDRLIHYDDVIICAMASQITGLTIVSSSVSSDADRRKHQSSASLAFVRRIHRWPVNSPHKGPVTQKMFPFDDVIM